MHATIPFFLSFFDGWGDNPYPTQPTHPPPPPTLPWAPSPGLELGGKERDAEALITVPHLEDWHFALLVGSTRQRLLGL